MGRLEGEAIFDRGRDVCVGFILDLVSRRERLEGRLGWLEEQSRKGIRVTRRARRRGIPEDAG